MAKRVANTFVLVEDVAQQNMVRQFLRRVRGKDFNYRKIRVEPLSSGRGSGEQRVRKQYAKLVKTLRLSLGKGTSAVLIVMIDADEGSTDDRHRQLARSLSDANVQERNANEPIVVLVPKRHVETWIQALLGNDVDESADYKRSNPTSQDFKNAAATLYDWTRENARPHENCPPSLSAAIGEWKKIPL